MCLRSSFKILSADKDIRLAAGDTLGYEVQNVEEVVEKVAVILKEKGENLVTSQILATFNTISGSIHTCKHGFMCRFLMHLNHSSLILDNGLMSFWNLSGLDDQCIAKVDSLGFIFWQSLAERLTRDCSGSKDELDTEKFVCKYFRNTVYKKQIDYLCTNFQICLYGEMFGDSMTAIRKVFFNKRFEDAISGDSMTHIAELCSCIKNDQSVVYADMISSGQIKCTKGRELMLPEEERKEFMLLEMSIDKEKNEEDSYTKKRQDRMMKQCKQFKIRKEKECIVHPKNIKGNSQTPGIPHKVVLLMVFLFSSLVNLLTCMVLRRKMTSNQDKKDEESYKDVTTAEEFKDLENIKLLKRSSTRTSKMSVSHEKDAVPGSKITPATKAELATPRIDTVSTQKDEEVENAHSAHQEFSNVQETNVEDNAFEATSKRSTPTKIQNSASDSSCAAGISGDEKIETHTNTQIGVGNTSQSRTPSTADGESAEVIEITQNKDINLESDGSKNVKSNENEGSSSHKQLSVKPVQITHTRQKVTGISTSLQLGRDNQSDVDSVVRNLTTVSSQESLEDKPQVTWSKMRKPNSNRGTDELCTRSDHDEVFAVPSSPPPRMTRSKHKSRKIKLYRNVMRNETYRMMRSIDRVVSEAKHMFGVERTKIFFDLLAAKSFNFGSAGEISDLVPNMAESAVRKNVISFFEHSIEMMNQLTTSFWGCPDSKQLQQMPEQNFISLIQPIIESLPETKTKQRKRLSSERNTFTMVDPEEFERALGEDIPRVVLDKLRHGDEMVVHSFFDERELKPQKEETNRPIHYVYFPSDCRLFIYIPSEHGSYWHHLDMQRASRISQHGK